MSTLDPALFEPDRERPADALAGRASIAFWSDVWRRFRQNVPAVISLVVLIVFTLLAIVAPLFARHPWDYTDLFATYQLPNWEHWFGTD
ncbi:MAG TPA: hypothetical protein VFE64_07140, partial [Devosia sp.]|nr:hypothetical protein [Devosia sp.]